MLYLGDCKDLISTLDKGSVDLMVTDPPYDHTGCRGGGYVGRRASFKAIEPISDGFDFGILDDCMNALRKTNLYIWGNWKAILSYLEYFKGYNTNLLTWHKTNPVPACSNKYLNDTEYCLFVREQGVNLNGRYEDHKTYWTTPLNTADSRRYNHPTVKPLDIIRTMVRNSCGGGGTVIDPFMGTGTTGV